MRWLALFLGLVAPMTRSMVGSSPLRGRLVTDHGRKFSLLAGQPKPAITASMGRNSLRLSAGYSMNSAQAM
jgi:hypothetical protein